jgi:hypothetical protein
MKRLATHFATTASFLFHFSGALSAQEFSRFTFSGGAGFTQPVGNTGRQLDTGWNIQGGAGVNFSQYVGAMLQLQYDRFGVNSFTLNNLGFPDGNLSVFSATIDPIVHLTPRRSRADIYLIVGGGWYRQNQQFTAPSVATVTGFNPFFGYYLANVPSNVVLAQYSVNKPGVNGGMGVGLGNKWGGKFFAEARYHRIFTGNVHTDYIPVTFGFRY